MSSEAFSNVSDKSLSGSSTNVSELSLESSTDVTKETLLKALAFRILKAREVALYKPIVKLMLLLLNLSLRCFTNLAVYYDLHPTQASKGLARVKTERIAGRQRLGKRSEDGLLS